MEFGLLVAALRFVGRFFENNLKFYNMKCIGYLGAEGDCIVIQQPTDIYPLLDWCQSRMIDNQENTSGSVNVEKWQKAIDYLSKLMDQVEKDGFGNIDDIEAISYE